MPTVSCTDWNILSQMGIAVEIQLQGFPQNWNKLTKGGVFSFLGQTVYCFNSAIHPAKHVDMCVIFKIAAKYVLPAL